MEGLRLVLLWLGMLGFVWGSLFFDPPARVYMIFGALLCFVLFLHFGL